MMYGWRRRLYCSSGGSGDDYGLKAHLKATLPNFMQPAEVVWLEAFPENANGKLDRNVLAEGLGGECLRLTAPLHFV